MDPAHADVLHPKVVVGAPSNFDLISVNLAALWVVKVDHMKIFLPGCRRDLPLWVHIAILKERLQDDVVVERLADLVELNRVAFVHRVGNAVLVLGLADLAVKRLPRVRNHLLITRHSDHIAPRKPRLQAVQVDDLLGASALARTDQGIFLSLLVCEAEAAYNG